MVSDELKDNFLYELWRALEQVGLPPDPNSIIGCKYVFKCDNGPILCGTITAIQISEDIELYVSNPKIWRLKIDSIIKTDKGWAAVILQEEFDRYQILQMRRHGMEDYNGRKFFYGELRLFFWPIPEAPNASNRIFKSNP